jgi:cobalt-zinc-cadmium efflux system protein
MSDQETHAETAARRTDRARGGERDRHAGHPAGRGHGRPGNTGHAGHAHGVGVGADVRWLTGALVLIVGYMTGEVVIGLLAHSLALLSDAAHMLTDAVSLVLALVAMRLAARPPRGGYTYGLKRAEILSAQANGLTLLVLSVWLAYEAIRRLVTPPDVTGGMVLATALVGVAINLGAVWMVSKANRTSLNVEGAFQHIVTDLYAFIATAAAGLVVVLTGFTRADAVASLVVVALMLKAGLGLVRESGRIFLEAAPAGLSPERIGRALAARPHVAEVHDLHIWQITSRMLAASAHVLVAPGEDCHAVRADLEAILAADYLITHTTLQVDHTSTGPLTIGGPTRTPDGHCEESRGRAHRPAGPGAEPGAGP